RIDQSRQAGRFACKSGEHDPAPALVHQRGEGLARVARRAAAFEYHFVAIRFKTLDPSDERRRTVEKGRLIEHADECDRQTYPARMIQNLSAIVQRAIDLGGFARYSCCISTNTTIGTLDGFANVRRLTTEVTRLPFQGRDGLEARPQRFPGTGRTVSLSAKMRRYGPAMVVVRSIFWQV